MEGGSYIDSGSVLANRGLNYGYGYGYGQHGNSGFDGSVTNANVVANRDIGVLDAIGTSTRDQFLNSRISDGDAALATRISDSTALLTDRIQATSIDAKFATVADSFASAERLAFANAQASERLAFANQAATDRELKAIQLKQTECCCKLTAGQAAIEAKLDAQATTAAAVAAARNEAALAQLLADRGHRGNH